MGHEAHERTQKIFKWFDCNHFSRWAGIKLEDLGTKSSKASMRVALKFCTGDGVVTGGVHVLIANATAVSLAMMHSENFTPLAEISEMKFLKPILLKDVNIVAEASFDGIIENRIVIKVSIKNNSGEIKSVGTFKYAILSSSYQPH